MLNKFKLRYFNRFILKKKTNRQLKQSSLSTLTALVNYYGNEKSLPQISLVLNELAPLIS